MVLSESTRVSLTVSARSTGVSARPMGFSALSIARKWLGTASRMALLLAAVVMPLSSFGQSKLYVVNGGADTISVINEYTGEVTATIKGPGHLYALAYNA